jgi:hypothetical protein
MLIIAHHPSVGILPQNAMKWGSNAIISEAHAPARRPMSKPCVPTNEPELPYLKG